MRYCSRKRLSRTPDRYPRSLLQLTTLQPPPTRCCPQYQVRRQHLLPNGGMMKATLHLTFSRIRIVRKVDMYCNYLVCVVHAIQQACLSTPAEVRGPRKVLERHSARAKQRLGQGIHRNCCIVTLKCNWFKCVT